jgi:heme-degrading monooxygenase HmoA
LIVRVLTAHVRANRVGAFDSLFRRQVDLLQAQPGLEYVKLARRALSDGGEEVLLFEEWIDAASMYAWVGPKLDEPRLVPGARELMDELRVVHYEALDRTVAESEPVAAIGDAPPESG